MDHLGLVSCCGYLVFLQAPHPLISRSGDSIHNRPLPNFTGGGLGEGSGEALPRPRGNSSEFDGGSARSHLAGSTRFERTRRSFIISFIFGFSMVILTLGFFRLWLLSRLVETTTPATGHP